MKKKLDKIIRLQYIGLILTTLFTIGLIILTLVHDKKVTGDHITEL